MISKWRATTVGHANNAYNQCSRIYFLLTQSSNADCEATNLATGDKHASYSTYNDKS